MPYLSVFSSPGQGIKKITEPFVILSVYLPQDRFNDSVTLTDVFSVQFLRISRDGGFTFFSDNLLHYVTLAV